MWTSGLEDWWVLQVLQRQHSSASSMELFGFTATSRAMGTDICITYIVFVQCNIRVTNEAQTLCMVIHNLDSLTGSILHSCSWSTMSHKQKYHCCGYHYPGAGSAGVSILHEECTWCQHFEKTVTAKHIVYSLLHHLQEKTVEYCGRNLFGLLWSAAHIYILLYTLHIFIL